MTELFTKEQVLELLKSQRLQCNLAAAKGLIILTAKEPEFPQPKYLIENEKLFIANIRS